MFSLVYKDLLPQWKSKGMLTGLICVIAGLFFAHSGSPVAAVLFYVPTYYAASYAAMYDYKFAQERFFLSMPVSRAEWVVSRYLSILAYFVGAIAIGVALGNLASLLGLPFSPPGFELCATAFAATAFYIGLSLPLYFRLGYERYKWLNFILMILSAIVSSAKQAIDGASINASLPVTIVISTSPTASLAIIGASALFLALSCALSVREFSKREF